MEQLIALMIGDYAWLWIVGFLTLFFKESIRSVLSSMTVFYGNDINDDDVLLIDGRPARVVRVGLMKTTFYLYTIDSNGNFINGTRRQIQNTELKSIIIEKPLSMFDDVIVELHKNMNLKRKDISLK